MSSSATSPRVRRSLAYEIAAAAVRDAYDLQAQELLTYELRAHYLDANEIPDTQTPKKTFYLML